MKAYRYDTLYTGNTVKIMDLLEDEIEDKGNDHIIDALTMSIEEIEEQYSNYFGWWVDLSIDNLKSEYGEQEEITTYIINDYKIIADLKEQGLLIITPKPKRKYEI